MLIGLTTESLLRGKKNSIGYKYSRLWADLLCRIIGLKVEIQGNVPQGRCIIMPNHRSYADIFATLAQVGCSFVAKAELRSWPLIGYAADAAGTLFVQRDSMESRKQTLADMKTLLDQNCSITIFPEGTTYKGPDILKLKAGTFKLAAEGGFLICPVALEYENPDDAWVGNDLFIPHFIRTFGRWKTGLKIRYGTPFQSEDHLFLIEETGKWITENLVELQQEWK